MPWSFTIGRFAGVAVRVHITFVIFLIWIGAAAWRASGPAAALDSVLFIALLFACVTLHEFGHILTARRFGIETNEVTLLPIGGVASLRRMPDTPLRELAVALAGPAVNVVIGFALIAALGSAGPASMDNIADPGQSMLARLASANLFLAAFNLIPAFPMDGGRVLHALLALWLGDLRATDIAAAIGQALAFVFGFFGLLYNPLLLFVAIFVYVAAADEARTSHLRRGLSDLKVADVMETRLATIPATVGLREAAALALDTAENDFPIVDGFGKPLGVTNRALMLAALNNKDGGAAVEDAAPRAPMATIRSTASAERALDVIRDSNASVLCVVDADGALIGLLPRQALAEAMIRAARPKSQAPLKAR